MTKYRTPSGVPFPDNFNRTGRAPVESSDFDPATANFLTAPRLLERMRSLVQQGKLHPADENHAIVELRRHYRALNGDRARPGEYLGDDRLPTEPWPGMPLEEPRYALGTNRGDVMRRAVERMDADRISDTLIATFRENDPANSTWARSDPSPAEARAEEPPSLRESIEASVAALGN